MKEVLLEIWIENKWHPVILVTKFIMICVLFLGAILLRGFLYSIIIVFAFLSSFFCLSMMLLETPQIDFFLPRSREGWYQMKRKKCLLVSGFYAGVIAGAYILNVSVTEHYQFDFVHVSAIWIICSLLFLIMRVTRLDLEHNRYQEDLEVSEEGDRNKLLREILPAAISIVVAFTLIVLLGIVDFAEVDGLLFLRQKRFRVMELLLYIGLLGRWLYMARRSQEKLKSFYMDD